MSQFYSIFDKKSVSFWKPFLCSHVAEATRSVQVGLQDAKSSLAMWPGDFALYVVGHWDGSTGHITPTVSSIPELIMEVAALVNPEVHHA